MPDKNRLVSDLPQVHKTFDLGVIAVNDFISSTQVAITVSKARSMSAMLNITFDHLILKVFIPAFQHSSAHNLSIGFKTWSPSRGDVRKL